MGGRNNLCDCEMHLPCRFKTEAVADPDWSIRERSDAASSQRRAMQNPLPQGNTTHFKRAMFSLLIVWTLWETVGSVLTLRSGFSARSRACIQKHYRICLQVLEGHVILELAKSAQARNQRDDFLRELLTVVGHMDFLAPRLNTPAWDDVGHVAFKTSPGSEEAQEA